MGKVKYYVVWIGKKPGVYQSWADVQAQIHGQKGARYKSYQNYGDALAAYERGPEGIEISNKPNPNSISVDAACSGNPGEMEYRCVETISKKEIFRKGPFPLGTNNIGEFLAIVHAAALLDKHQKHDIVIYTDSMTAMAWVRNKKVKTNLERNKQTESLWDLIERATIWLSQNTIKNKIIKWPTEKWGEIPADFGRK